MSWSEDSLHQWIAELRASADEGHAVVGAPGSDAAVMGSGLARPVVCVDQLVEGKHFTRAADPALIGEKVVARALSDLAATAATPRAVLLTLRADDSDSPARTVDETWLRAILRGAWECGRRHGAPLIGGDITSGEGPLGLSATAIGDFEFDGTPPGREHARPGDVVLLTGALGGSILSRHLRIQPRLQEGRWLYQRGVRAMMDVSDGLALDLSRVARRSAVAIQLELEQVPLHADAHALAAIDGQGALQHALGDGEDHELIAFATQADARALLAQGSPQMAQLCAIGRVVERSRSGDPGLWTRSSRAAAWEPVQDPKGYVHGGSHGG